jgi:hypothetical protein
VLRDDFWMLAVVSAASSKRAVGRPSGDEGRGHAHAAQACGYGRRTLHWRRRVVVEEYNVITVGCGDGALVVGAASASAAVGG